MIKNYILVSWRSAQRNLSAFLINLIGLVIGFTMFTVAYSLAHYIETFDQGFSMSGRTYSLGLSLASGNPYGKAELNDSFSGTIDGLKEVTSEIEFAGRVANGKTVYRKDELYLPMIYRGIDADTLDIFDVKLLSGSRRAFTTGLDVALISEKEALRHFGGSEALGQTLTIGDDRTVQIVGIFGALPANSHLSFVPGSGFSFDFLVPIALHEKLSGRTVTDNWDTVSTRVRSYIVAAAGTNIPTLEARLKSHLLANINTPKNAEEENYYTGMTVLPLSQIFMQNISPGDGISGTNVMRILGSILLGLAVLNAISLASARMIDRSREVGLRRIFGARKSDLSIQFILENTLYAVLALAMSVLISVDIFTFMREATGLDLRFTAMLDTRLFAGLLFAAIFVGLLSSLYPILLFSGLLKSVSLSRTLTLAKSASWLKKILVWVQFTAVSALVLTFIVIQQQTSHLLNDIHPVASDRMAVISGLKSPETSKTVAEAVRAQPGVASVSRNDLPPYSRGGSFSVMTLQGVGEDLRIQSVSIDSHYFEQLNIPVLAGRLLDENRAPDLLNENAFQDTGDEPLPAHRIMVNQSAMRVLGYQIPSEIIGKTFVQSLKAGTSSPTEFSVVGVVADANIAEPTQRLSPTFYSIDETNHRALTILFNPGAEVDLTALNKAWQAVDPTALVQVTSGVDLKAKALKTFDVLRYGLLAVTVITLTMAAAGLYALTAYLASSKKREVSIRKVHGATVRRILQMLMWQFTKPVFAALALTLPLMFMLLNAEFLTLYNNQINLGIGPILVTLALVMTVAWGTSFVHIVRTARARPAEVLRSE